MKEIVDKIIKELDKSINTDFENDKAKFSREGYTCFEISDDHFHRFDLIKNDLKIGFIDGGNTEIFGSSNFSLQLVRVYGCVFSKNIKIKEIMSEFFILVKSFGNGEIKYNCDIFPIKGDILVDKKDLEFSSMDETIKNGVFRGSIGKIAEIARRFSELRLAERIIDEISDGFIVLDGTLESCHTNEEKYLESLYEKGISKGVLVCALAKTTTIYTEKGNNLIGILNSIGKDELWYYHPLVEINNNKHKADMYVVKLNNKSKYVFRFEVFKKQKYEIEMVFGCLAANSLDLGFPGYAFGLITADKFARVSNKEKEYYKFIFTAKIGKKEEKLAKYLSSLDAHSILDGKN